MKRNKHIISLLIALATLAGCDDNNFNTSHPDEGGVVMTIDWSNIESTIPATYHALIASSSGQNKLFENLSGESNSLAVPPGEATLYVYNNAEQITVTGKKATVKTEGSGIVSAPGLFYSFSKQIVTERDRDYAHTALMNRQTGELKFTLAIKPASMVEKIRTISATLEGVAAELDMQTNELSAPSTVTVNFSKNAYYAVANIRLIGFIRQNAQNLRLKVEFENGNSVSATSDLSSLVSAFNESKNKLFTLNASLYAPEENASTVTLDAWECNTESRYLSVDPSAIDLSGTASSQSITIVTDQPAWGYTIIQTGNWLSAVKTDNLLTLTTVANTGSDMRQATINVSAGGLNESITVTQAASGNDNEYYVDRETVKLQSAAIGRGVNIVVLGDGYTSNEMKKGTGKYEDDMRAAADYFFSTYPISEFRNYFNVYMITAISNQAGISNESTNTTVDTKFKTLWEGGNSTGIGCNEDTVYNYVRSIPDLLFTNIHDITVIMPINVYERAGTCYLYRDEAPSNYYANGFSISMITAGAEFKEITVHEAAGHGFAKATDEYVYRPNETVPQPIKDFVNEIKPYGFYENVDFFDDILLTSWKGFAGLPKYSMVGTFEGADLFGKGIWRPEYISCMDNNVLYFNAPTRWAQVRRIYQLAGINYTFSQFLQDDVIPEVPSYKRSKAVDFIPLAPPVFKVLPDNRGAK